MLFCCCCCSFHTTSFFYILLRSLVSSNSRIDCFIFILTHGLLNFDPCFVSFRKSISWNSFTIYRWLCFCCCCYGKWFSWFVLLLAGSEYHHSIRFWWWANDQFQACSVYFFACMSVYIFWSFFSSVQILFHSISFFCFLVDVTKVNG